MEGTPTATLEAPAAEVEDSPAVTPDASERPPEREAAEESAAMNAILRGHLPTGDAASNSGGDAGDESAEARGGASDPPGIVKPSDAQPGTGRRSAAAELAHLRGENERLQKALDEINPPPPDASEEARAKAIETEQRFRRLLVKKWDDQDWTQEDIDFLEGEKRRREVAPELQQHYEAILADDLKVQTDRVNAWQQQLRAKMYEDYGSAKDLPGVDIEAIRKAPTFAERDRIVYEAGRAANEPELKRLRDENADLRRDLYGAVRAPMNGGRSSPRGTYDENSVMNTLLRGGRV